MFEINHLPRALSVGYAGENVFRSVSVDFSEWISDYPGAEITADYQRPDGIVYVPEHLSRIGNVLTWEPDSTDLALSGSGKIKYRLNDSETVGKSETVLLRVAPSVAPTGDIPDPYRSWYDRMQTDSMRVEKVAPHLYNIRFSDIDYAKGAEYYRKYKPEPAACSAVAKGSLVGRNYDWKYDETLSFVVHTPAVMGRHDVIGVSRSPSGLTKEIAESGGSSALYDIVPFMLLDGVNDSGLFCEINVVPAGDMGTTTGTHPDKEDLFAAMIPRYVLDYASSVDEAVALLENRNIFCADADGLREEFHFLLRDRTKTVEIEFINNVMVIIDTFVNDKPIATNFYLYGWDGTRETLTAHAQGLERYDILSSGYDAVTDAESMYALMQSVMYTKTYSDAAFPLWLSEFNGDWTDTRFHIDLTVDSPSSDYAEIRSYYIDLFDGRERDGQTWQTVHTSVYDLEKRTLICDPQESGKRYLFALQNEGRVYF